MWFIKTPAPLYKMVNGSLQHDFGYNSDHCWTSNGHFRLYVYTFYSHYNSDWIAKHGNWFEPKEESYNEVEVVIFHRLCYKIDPNNVFDKAELFAITASLAISETNSSILWAVCLYYFMMNICHQHYSMQQLGINTATL